MQQENSTRRNRSWVRWTVAQGLSGALNRIIQKLVGTITTSAADASFTTTMIGCTQAILAAVVVQARKVQRAS